MPLNWTNYDEYFDQPRDQEPIDEHARQEVEGIAAGQVLIYNVTISVLFFERHWNREKKFNNYSFVLDFFLTFFVLILYFL